MQYASPYGAAVAGEASSNGGAAKAARLAKSMARAWDSLGDALARERPTTLAACISVVHRLQVSDNAARAMERDLRIQWEHEAETSEAKSGEPAPVPTYYKTIYAYSDAAPRPQEDKKFVYEESDLKIVKTLGSGNFATTYLAEFVGTKASAENKLVALKIPKDTVSAEECKKEMMGLLNVAGQVNVIKFIGIIQKSGSQAFLTEFCELGSLDSLHEKFDLIEENTFLKIARGLFLGLMHLHHFRIIHRDVACRNLLVKRGFEVRIADFGLAVRAPEGSYKIMPTEQLPWPWMPPETLRDATFTFKSDVWAAGVTLWEILHKGAVPYFGSVKKNGVEKTLTGIKSGRLKLSPSQGTLTSQRNLMFRCLEQDVKLRPDACGVLLDLIPDGLDWIRTDGTEMMKKTARAHIAKGTQMPNLLEERSKLPAVIFDGKVYAVGGGPYTFSELGSVEMLDLKDAKAKWKTLPSMKEIRSNFGAALWDGKLYAGGGVEGYETMYQTVEMLDLRNVEAGWSNIPNLASDGGMLKMVAHDGCLYAITMEAVERLDLSNLKNGWTKIAKNGTYVDGAVVVGSCLYALDTKHGLRSMNVSDKTGATLEWKTVRKANGTKLVPHRCGEGCAVVAWRSKLYTVGGGFPPSDAVEMLDLSSPERGWVVVAKLDRRRTRPGAVITEDGNIIVVGGDDEGPLKSVEALRVGLANAT